MYCWLNIVRLAVDFIIFNSMSIEQTAKVITRQPFCRKPPPPSPSSNVGLPLLLPPPSVLQPTLLGHGYSGSPKSVVVRSESRVYVFNCGEEIRLSLVEFLGGIGMERGERKVWKSVGIIRGF